MRIKHEMIHVDPVEDVLLFVDNSLPYHGDNSTVFTALLLLPLLRLDGREEDPAQLFVLALLSPALVAVSTNPCRWCAMLNDSPTPPCSRAGAMDGQWLSAQQIEVGELLGITNLVSIRSSTLERP